MEVERIDYMIQQQRLYQKIGYGVIPIMIALRAFYTAICFSTGAFITEQNITFKQCFNISLKADIIFLLEVLVRINYFSLTGVNSLEEINIRIFSIYQLLGMNIESWSTYPFHVLNIFEFGYWVLLVLFIRNYTQNSFRRSIGFVVKTYGLGLLLWIGFVIFLMLNLT